MKIKKYTIIEVQFSGLTLLSEEEYLRFEDNIPQVGFMWWLRSPGDNQSNAALIYPYGSCYYSDVSGVRGIRPTLIINQESLLQIGDKFNLYGHDWTMISDEYALCDESFCRMAFRRNWEAKDANVYDASDIKKYLDAVWEKMKESEQNV